MKSLVGLFNEIQKNIEKIKDSDIRERLSNPSDIDEYIRNLDNLSSLVNKLKKMLES